MANIQINFADSLQTRIIDAFCGQYEYKDEILIDNVLTPNPETKAQFARRMVREYIKQIVKAHEATTASESAKATATQAVENEVVLT